MLAVADELDRRRPAPRRPRAPVGGHGPRRSARPGAGAEWRPRADRGARRSRPRRRGAAGAVVMDAGADCPTGPAGTRSCSCARPRCAGRGGRPPRSPSCERRDDRGCGLVVGRGPGGGAGRAGARPPRRGASSPGTAMVAREAGALGRRPVAGRAAPGSAGRSRARGAGVTGPTPRLVEHLRARAARDPRVAGAGLDRVDLAEVVEEMIDEERRILAGGARGRGRPAVVERGARPRPARAAAARPRRRPRSWSAGRPRCSSSAPGASRGRRRASPTSAPAPRDRPHPGAARPPRGRGQPDGRRPPARRLARQRRHPAARPRRPGRSPSGASRGGRSRGDDLVALGTLTRRMRELLGAGVRARRNILVSGGTGARQDHAAQRAVGASCPPRERIITIEDAAELRIAAAARGAAREPAAEPGGPRRGHDPRRWCATRCACGPTASSSARSAAREALDMLQAMNTGHDGLAVDASTPTRPRDALRRLETLALMADVDLPHAAVREQVASALDLVVHQARLPDGRRRVVEVAAVAGGPEGATLTPLCMGTREARGRRTGRRSGGRPAPQPTRRSEHERGAAALAGASPALGARRGGRSRRPRDRGRRGGRRAGRPLPARAGGSLPGSSGRASRWVRGPRSWRRPWRCRCGALGARPRPPTQQSRPPGPPSPPGPRTSVGRPASPGPGGAQLPGVAQRLAAALRAGLSLRQALAGPPGTRPSRRARSCSGASRSSSSAAGSTTSRVPRGAGARPRAADHGHGDPRPAPHRREPRAGAGRLSDRLEERAQLARELRGATAQARMTAWLVAALPLAGGALAELARPEPSRGTSVRVPGRTCSSPRSPLRGRRGSDPAHRAGGP